MKQRFVRSFALGAVVVALVTCLSLLVGGAPPSGDAGVGVGSAFGIEPPMARYLRDLDPQEQREQIRDWAVIATIAKLGATPAQAAAATYELPPARLPYFDELYAFEYGRGRRAYLGERVLLFRDDDDPDPQATIGRLADRVRMENGEIPSEVEIYLVHDQRDDGSIRIERAADVAGSQLFSPAYGYVEGTADDVSGMSAWLARTDDLSLARIDHGHVTLGGRRFSQTPTPNLTAEDIAVLYQAHKQFDTPRAPARATLASLPPEARTAAARLRSLLEARAPKEALDQANDALTLNLLSGTHAALYDAISALAKPVESPGFSLDPQWLPDPSSPQHPLVLSRLRAFAADPCGALADIARRADALERAEPDDTRRTALTRSALLVREHLSAVLCPALERIASPLHALASKIALAQPTAWERRLAGYDELVEQWEDMLATDRRPRADGDGLADVGLFRDARRDHARWVAYLRGSPPAKTHYLRVQTHGPLVEEPRSLAERRDWRLRQAAWIAITALEFYEHESQAQCARYIGTQGTGVGMTMFYTDLLGKIWTDTDYGLSAPLAAIPGFVIAPGVDLEPAFREDEKLPGRTWFGPRADAVSRTAHGAGSSFFFDHTFSRIYAADHQPQTPWREVRPSERSRRTVGWWNRHFEDIASYEPEYHRQNQIMKWALVTAALSESSAAPYLGQVQVRRDSTFSGWQQANRARLRFSESLPALTWSPSGRECFPLLSSYPFQAMGGTTTRRGGIDSIAPTALANVPKPNPALALGARRPYVNSLVAESPGTALRAHPTVAGEGVVFADAASVPTRAPSGDIALGTPKMAYQTGSAPHTIEILAGDTARPVGVLDAEVTSNQVKLRWTDGMVELERLHVPTMPESLAAADTLAAEGDLVTAAKSYQARAATRPTTAIELARETVVRAAQRNPTAVLKAVQQLEGKGAQLLPESRNSVLHAVSEVGSPEVAAHVKTALDQGLPLTNEYGAISVERGHMIVTRHIEALPVSRLSTTTPTDLSTSEVYLDTRLRVGQEGLVPDTGGPAARWQQMRNVRVDEMNASAIGQLPDRIITGNATRATFDHVSPRRVPTTTMPTTPVYFIRQCDGEHRTATTDDDC